MESTAVIPLAYKLATLTQDALESGDGYITRCVDVWSDAVNPKLDVQLPTLEGLAQHLNVPRSTVDRWRKDYPQFNELCERILNAQAVKLINGGLSGAYNATIVKVMLSKHGYVEKVDQADKPMSITVMLADYSKAKEIEEVKAVVS